MTTRKVVCTSQPQGAVSIDWSNPINRGLAFALASGGDIDAVSQIRPTLSASSKKGVSSVGVGIAGTGMALGSELVSFGNAGADVFKSAGTLHVLLTISGNVGSVNPLGVVSKTANSTFGWALTLTYGQPELTVYGSASDLHVLSSQVLQDGKTYLVSVTIPSGLPVASGAHIYVNAVDTTTGSPSGTGTSGTDASVLMKVGGGGNSTNDFMGVISYVSLVRREQTPEEIRAVAANPWQIFQKVLPPIFTSVSRSLDELSLDYIQRKTVRTSQPALPSVGIDWGNPITKGLHFGYSPVHESANLAGGKISDPYGWGESWKSRVTQHGKFVSNSGSENYCIQSESSSTTKGEFSSLLVCIPLAQITQANPNLAYEGSGWFAASISLRDGVFGNRYSGAGLLKGSTSYVLGQEYIAVATSTATEQKIYVNGALENQILASVGNPEFSRQVSIWATPLAGQIYIGLALCWHRKLSNEEIKSLSENPWQIFQKQNPLPSFYETHEKLSDVNQSFNKRNVPRVQQPQGSVEVDWSNPLTIGLSNTGVSGDTGFADAITKRMWFEHYGALSPLMISSEGRAYKLENYNHLISQNPNVIPSQNTDRSIAITIHFGGFIPGVECRLTGIYDADDYKVIVTAAGYLGWSVGGQYHNDTGITQILGTTPVSPGVAHTVSIVRVYGFQFQIWLDGVLDVAVTDPGGRTSYSLYGPRLSGSLYGPGNAGWISFVALHIDNGALDIKRLHENPWQIFEPQTKTTFLTKSEPVLDQVISCDPAQSVASGETAAVVVSVKGTYIPRGAARSRQSQQASINWNHPLVKAANICYIVSSHEGGSAKVYWKDGSVETGMPTAKFGAAGRRTSAGSAEILGITGAGKFLSNSRSIFALFENGNVGSDKLVMRHAAGTGFFAGTSSGVSFSVRTNAGTYFTPRIAAPFGSVKAWGVWNYEANLGSLFIDGFTPVTIATTLNWGSASDSIDVGGQDVQGLVLAFVCTGVVPSEVRRALSDNPWQIFTEQPVPSFLALEINYNTVVSCEAASSVAVGATVQINRTLLASAAPAAAIAPTAQIDKSLPASVAPASATGPTSIVSKTTVVFCTVAPSVAAGVTCSLSGGVSISCTSAQAAATAPSAQIDLSIKSSVSQDSAAGVTARTNKSLILGLAQATALGSTARRNDGLACGVGAATAQGVTCATNGAATITCSVGDSAAAAPSAQVEKSLLAGVGSGAALGIGTLLDKSTLTLVTPASARGTTAYADISVITVAAPASAVGITIPVSGAVTITTIAASASANGITENINTGASCSVANAGAAGVTAVLQTGVVISASVAAAIAAGITSQLDKAINAAATSAFAAGVTANIVVPGNETIGCSRALASAKGVTSIVSFTIIITFDVENIQLVSDLCLSSSSLSPISKSVVFQSKLIN